MAKTQVQKSVYYQIARGDFSVLNEADRNRDYTQIRDCNYYLLLRAPITT